MYVKQINTTIACYINLEDKLKILSEGKNMHWGATSEWLEGASVTEDAPQ